jgi:hypothetical protein
MRKRRKVKQGAYGVGTLTPRDHARISAGAASMVAVSDARSSSRDATRLRRLSRQRASGAECHETIRCLIIEARTRNRLRPTTERARQWLRGLVAERPRFLFSDERSRRGVLSSESSPALADAKKTQPLTCFPQGGFIAKANEWVREAVRESKLGDALYKAR